MFNMGSAPSLSDIAAVTKDGNGDGWGNGEEHVEKAIISMRDIWSEASPELKRRMKTELSTLVDNMTI